MYTIHEFFHLFALGFGEEAGLLIAAREVDV